MSLNSLCTRTKCVFNLPCSGNYLVLVRAQVMIRDDSSGGWVPMEGGGLSNVSVRKRILPSVEDAKHEYLICGKRISDQMVRPRYGIMQT